MMQDVIVSQRARDAADRLVVECALPWEYGAIFSSAFARFEAEIEAAMIERCAGVAKCAFDDRPNSRSGHHSEMDWTDGYRDGTRAAEAAIRNLKGQTS